VTAPVLDPVEQREAEPLVAHLRRDGDDDRALCGHVLVGLLVEDLPGVAWVPCPTCDALDEGGQA
jgi:hypothetical protein